MPDIAKRISAGLPAGARAITSSDDWHPARKRRILLYKQACGEQNEWEHSCHYLDGSRSAKGLPSGIHLNPLRADAAKLPPGRMATYLQYFHWRTHEENNDRQLDLARKRRLH